MNLRKSLNLWLTLGLICLFGAISFHAASHHHEFGSEENQCPLCHSGTAATILPFDTAVVSPVVHEREFTPAKSFRPIDQIHIAGTQRRAPPVAA